MNLSISSKERRKLFDNLRKLSFNDASADTAPNELFPYGLISRQPRDRQYDRETALIAATGVEQGLECAIAAHLCRREDASKLLFADEGVLRDFNAKIKMAYIIGVVGKKTAADIQAIRGGFDPRPRAGSDAAVLNTMRKSGKSGLQRESGAHFT